MRHYIWKYISYQCLNAFTPMVGLNNTYTLSCINQQNDMSCCTTKPTKWSAPSEDSDQPGHLPSLIRAFLCTQWVAKDPILLQADSEDSDQTGRPRLTWVFAGRTCHFVGFVLEQLILKIPIGYNAWFNTWRLVWQLMVRSLVMVTSSC